MQEIAEKSKSSSTLILLDWEKAFDRVLHDKLIEALHRLMVPNKLISLLGSFYENVQLKVRQGSVESAWRAQEGGIRLGCPYGCFFSRHKKRAQYQKARRVDRWYSFL